MLGIAAGMVLMSGASLGEALRGSGRGVQAAGVAVGRGVATATGTAVRGSRRAGEEARAIARTVAAPSTRRDPGVEPVDGADNFPDIFDEEGHLPPSPALAGGPGPGADDDVDGAGGAVDLFPDADAHDVLDDPLDEAGAEPEGDPFMPVEVPVAAATGDGASDDPAPDEDVHGGAGGAPRGGWRTPPRKSLRTSGRVSRMPVAQVRDTSRRLVEAVPNPDASMVTLGDVWRDFPEGTGPLAAWLGLDIGGKAVYLDIARMPHLLIAGSTGTGKSVCLNGLLASILLRATPDQLRLVMIDPKKVELNHYEGIPHLLTPVVTNMKNATAVLANIVREMESRYEIMGAARARNLTDWNAIRRDQGLSEIPHILVVIDELADLMMVAPGEVEDAIIRIAQKARAVGIHLVLATQRPSVDVITGMIKANVPSRIAFAVSSQVDSRVVLDSGGAESLLGNGDMLFRPVGTSRLQRLQGAYVGEDEILAITDHWRRQGAPEMREDLLERAEPAEPEVDAGGDEMLRTAVETVVQQGTASVSLLQRRLGVGYARAGRLVDSLERLGVISGHEGSKPRTVLIGEGDIPRVLGIAAVDTEDDPDA